MQKKFLSSISLIVLLNLMVKPLYILGIDAEVQNRVGQEAYGSYFALLGLSFIFNILIDFGINNFNNRNIAQNTHLIGSQFSRLMSLKSVLALIYAVITLLLGSLLGYSGDYFFILAILVFNQVLVSFIFFVRSNLAGLHLFKQDSLVSVLDRFLLIIFCAILLFTGLFDFQFSIEVFALLQTLAYGLTLLISILMLRGHFGSFIWKIDKPFAGAILRRSLPYALFVLAGSMYTRIDGLMLDNLLENGSAEAGTYAQGYRFYEAASMFALLFGVILLPIYARMIKEKEAVAEMLAISGRILIGVGAMAAVFVFFNADLILNVWYVSVAPNAAAAFTALMIGFVGNCMFYIYGTLMTANENLKSLNRIAFGGLFLNVLLNLWLIPTYTAFGAALATAATQLFAGALQMVFVYQHFKLKLDFWLIARFCGFIIAYVGLSFFLLGRIENAPIALIISLVAGVVLILLSGIIRPRHLFRIWKAEK